MVTRYAFIALLLSLAACRGPEGLMGPQGAQGAPGASGPGTRLVKTGTTDAAGRYVADLPAEAGSSTSNPPTMSCFLRNPSAGIATWLPISDGWKSTTDPYCALDFDFYRGNFTIQVFRAPAGWSVAIVIVY